MNIGKQMPWAQRKSELLLGLNNTVVEEVHCSVGHVAEVIGPERAQKLAKFMNATEQVVKPKKPKSSLPDEERFLCGTLGKFNRVELKKALEEQTVNPHKPGAPTPPKG